MQAAAWRFLADESCDFAIVRDLRAHGYDAMVPAVRQLVQEHGEQLISAFVVVQPGHIRISRRPR